MIRIDGGQGLQPSHDANAAAKAANAARAGTLRGEQVLVKDVTSMLADGAEELSMHHAEKVESKEIDERRLEADEPMDLMEIADIQAYLDAAGQYDDPEKMAELVRRMQATRGDPREVARQQSRDPAQQYVLLQLALSKAREDGVPIDVIERLQDAIADLEMEAGPRIRAALNTRGVASEQARTPEQFQTFQDAYRDVVLGHNTLAQTLVMVLDRLGGAAGDDFQKGLEALIRALGADLSASRPSTDSARLQSLVQDLYQLEVTSTVLENCKKLATRMNARLGVTTMEPVELMKELVAITGESWIGPTRFAALAQRFMLQEILERIAFHTATKEMLRTLPVKVYTDPDARQAVLTSAQAALDKAIEDEEEEEERRGESEGDEESSEDGQDGGQENESGRAGRRRDSGEEATS